MKKCSTGPKHSSLSSGAISFQNAIVGNFQVGQFTEFRKQEAKPSTEPPGGTASIAASESRHDNSVERQTHQTIGKVEALIASGSCRCHGLDSVGATLGDLAVARVYVKRQEDYDAVRSICRARLGDLPMIYTVGDICRPELLVEIEWIAFVRRQSATDEPNG